MKKFSKILETTLQKKFYKATCDVELIIEADTEGEAGKMVDSDLGGLEYLSDFKISDISEISRDEYKEKTLSESFFIKNGKTNESIELYWNNHFGNKIPSQSQKLEFYHFLRTTGFGKDQIFDTLKDKI